MLRTAAGITGCATLVLLACVLIHQLREGLRESRRLRSKLGQALIAQAAHDEYSADLLLWEDEIQESRNDAQP